ncbi:hypothetical protein ACX8Z9_10700 [Arthrobacter halodurans]|uniref:Rv3660c-like CheY-like N-terminal domain-containing protein n=1 Tax=Arthrobacter halodurans TaxID=516699 RepID=A0ABV4UME1_9MICC
MSDTERFVATPEPGRGTGRGPAGGRRGTRGTDAVPPRAGTARWPPGLPRGDAPEAPGPREGADEGLAADPDPAPAPGQTPDTSPAPAPPTDPPRAADCLLITGDGVLADQVALVAAAAGAVLSVRRDAAAARPEPASVLLLGPDAAVADAAHRAGTAAVLVGHAADEDVLWRVAARHPGARVAVLPRASAWLGEFLGELGLRGGPGRVLLVAGASGGAGTTTLAVLAAAAATLQGARTLLIDADPHSRGLWPILKPRVPEGVGWEDLARSRGQVAPAHLAEILPLAQGTAVLTWGSRSRGDVTPMPVLGEVVAASRRIYDTVVVDAGRSAGVDPSLCALADEGLEVWSAGTPAHPSLMDHGAGAALPWGVAVTGRLPSGEDAARIAARTGLRLACYLPPLRAVPRAAADGMLVSVMGRRGVRRLLEPLGALARGLSGARPRDRGPG